MIESIDKVDPNSQQLCWCICDTSRLTSCLLKILSVRNTGGCYTELYFLPALAAKFKFLAAFDPLALALQWKSKDGQDLIAALTQTYMKPYICFNYEKIGFALVHRSRVLFKYLESV
jgi:hypothetical protein